MGVKEYNVYHNLEFVAELVSGETDWVDPVVSVEVTEDEIIVTNQFRNTQHEYRYSKSDIINWQVRPYSPDTTKEDIE